MRKLLSIILLAIACVCPKDVYSQSPQAPAGTPISSVNTKYNNGIGIGFWPTAGAGLTLNIAAGTSNFGSIHYYGGGSLTLTDNTTNYVYLNSSGAPAFNTTGFTTNQFPISIVTTSGGTITLLSDVRTLFFTGGGATIPNTTFMLQGDGAGNALATHMDDGHTTASTITSSEPIAIMVAGGQGGTVNLTEGTAASAASGHDILYADSTAHCVEYSANGGSFACLGTGGGGATIPLPLSAYNVGKGMMHVTDSTGPGSVLVLSGAPVNGSGSNQCPGPSNATLDMVYLRSDVTPYQYWNCLASGWQSGTPGWSTTEILFTNYNQLSPRLGVTSDYPYPGTFYSNTSGAINTGNAACMDVFRAEVLGHPSIDPDDYMPVTWYNQCGIGDWFNWAGGIGWGSITDAPTELNYVIPAMVLYEGTPKHGKLLARNASTSGTWTAYDPTTATTTGAASSGVTALTVASGTGIVQFAQVADTTNPSSLAPDTYVSSVSGTSVTLSQNTTAAISGDTLTFVDTSTPPFRAGYGMCSSSGTLTFTTMPTSGGVWVNYLLKGSPVGTDVANVILDSVTVGTISSGDASGFNTNHNTYAWGAKRFALVGSGQHTVAVTPTAGNICVFYVVTPNPTTWSGLSQPRVVSNLMLPYGDGYNPGFDNLMKQAMATQLNQLKFDGVNVLSADLWLTWPESGGNTQYCEHVVCTYPNGLASLVAATPHYTKMGDLFNAWGFLQADGRLPETTALDAGVTFSISSGAPAVPATPNVLARKRGFVSRCIFITQASDGTTDLGFSILLNGATVTSGTVTHGSSAGTVSTFLPTANSNGLVFVAPGQMWELDVSTGTSSWKGSLQCM